MFRLYFRVLGYIIGLRVIVRVNFIKVGVKVTMRLSGKQNLGNNLKISEARID